MGGGGAFLCSSEIYPTTRKYITNSLERLSNKAGNQSIWYQVKDATGWMDPTLSRISYSCPYFRWIWFRRWRSQRIRISHTETPREVPDIQCAENINNQRNETRVIQVPPTWAKPARVGLGRKYHIMIFLNLEPTRGKSEKGIYPIELKT